MSEHKEKQAATDWGGSHSQIAALQILVASLEASGKQKYAHIGRLETALQRCTCQPDQKDLSPPDWEKGLPLELLALIAGLGGRDAMKAMRGVCKLWQQGFESSTTVLTIGPEGPLLPADGSFCERFPMLASLHLGDSSIAEDDLVQLEGLRRLQNLSLGTQGNFFKPNYHPGALFSSLEGTCFNSLPPGITTLSLRCCHRLWLACMRDLEGLSLTRLHLSSTRQCQARNMLSSMLFMRDYDFSGVLEGISRWRTVTALELQSDGLEDAWLQHLARLPLTFLDLSMQHDDNPFGRFGWHHFTGAGLEFLKMAPITSLKLSGCIDLQDSGLEFLRGMPLRLLDLSGCVGITEVGVGFLRGMHIESLDLGDRCRHLTDASLSHLVGMPLSYLSLKGCGNVTGDGLKHLQGLPLTKLNLEGGWELKDPDLMHLVDMPLSDLSLSRCSGLTSACVEVLLMLPLKKVRLVGCSGVSYLTSAQLKWNGVDCIRDV